MENYPSSWETSSVDEDGGGVDGEAFRGTVPAACRTDSVPASWLRDGGGSGRREAVAPRKITFATPTEQQPFTTPKDNMKKAAEILKKKDEEIDIDYVRTLVASVMKQRSKADTSRRLESNPDDCMSTAQKDAHDNRHRDDESRTGSSERGRRTREHPNPIPVPSKTPPSDPKKGKDAKYTGRDKYRNPSPPPNGYPRPARIWLSDLEKNSIFCWFDLKTAFEKHFRGTYKRPATTSDLQACIQKKGETSRNFLTRCDHTAADDDAGGDLAATAIPLHQQKKNRDNGNSSGSKRKNPPMTRKVADPKWSSWLSSAKVKEAEEAAAAEAEPAGASSVVMSSPLPEPAPPKPTRRYKRARKHRPRGKGGKGKNKDKEEDSSEVMDEDDASPDPKGGSAAKPNPFDKKSVGAYHTFLGTPTVRASKKDHPTFIPKECYALVVSPRIDGYDFSKCLMDGGASLNIMYLETLERMNLTKEHLKHSTTEFHGVVPGKKANSLGSIRLPVAFGDINNFREEMITFEVVPFKRSYHVIFGRPT
ncbi:hypothetical protein QYE76_068207 [Lolium multiflorum]|uniref:Retrotransposon gag domain-containing protein n=1 Tax=Lolium multiflorum TaxID=4521 RepID=A0AAD8WDQ8_LOLMU|nr:hypothetical protein QYE76_068207 [Lolium multiflorum]